MDGPWLMKDYPNLPSNNFVKDYNARKFIRERIPGARVPESFKFEGPGNKFTFEVMARAKGVPMEDVIDTLSDQEVEDLSNDLKAHVQEWRQITSPHMGGVDGSELMDGLIGTCRLGGCIKTGSNEEEWLENLSPALLKGLLVSKYYKNKGPTQTKEVLDSWVKEADEQLAELKANFPKGGPYVLTHCDLHYENIFVSNDNEEKKWKVTSIIDWELAGFYPWWVEAVKFNRHFLTDVESDKFDKLEKPIRAVMSKWEQGGGPGVSKHGLDQANVWYRRPFCPCQVPVARIGEDSLGWEGQEHADVFDVDSDSSDSNEDGRRFNKTDRAFQRWFNEISKRER